MEAIVMIQTWSLTEEEHLKRAAASAWAAVE
jgi:hypothetical protein